MRRHSFDPSLPMRYAKYGRMSSKGQNPESPEQQYDKIDRTLKRLGHDWVHVEDFRDDAISGKYFGKRPLNVGH